MQLQTNQGTPEIEAAEADAQAKSRGGISIGAILALLMAAIIIPALIFSLMLLQSNNRAQQRTVTALAEATAASISLTVDRHVTGMVNSLRVFATSQSLQEGNLEQFHHRATISLEGSDTYLVGVTRDLKQIFSTNLPFGTPIGDVSMSFAATKALETGEPVVTGAFLGRTTQRWVFNVMYALPDAAPGEIRLLLLSQPVEGLESAISRQNLRAGWNATIVDGAGLVVASSDRSVEVGKAFFLADAIFPTSFTQYRAVEFEGQTYETVRSPSENSEWQTIVWAPTAVVRAPMTRSIRSLALGGLAILAVGAVLAWVLGRQITRPIRWLARDARRLGAGEKVEAIDYTVAEIATVSHALAQASKERQQAENEIRFLMREVAHRSKNQLTVVSSIAKQTARHARTFAAFQDSFQKRVHGLARSTDLLIAGGAAGVELNALVETQIGPFRPSDADRVQLSGVYFRLSNQAAQTLGLALHELATNAVKYGAFAVADGRLVVTWTQSTESLELVWREYVPRLRRRAETRGFGTEVIERMLGGTLDATIDRILHRNGIEYRFVMRIDRIEAQANDNTNAETA